MDILCVNPSGPTLPAFPQGVQVGPWLHVSGQGPLKDGALVSADPLDEARQCFASLEEVLAAADARFSDVVKLTCFLTDPAAYSAYAQGKQEVLGTSGPAGTAVIISALLIPRALMEVEAVVYKKTLANAIGRPARWIASPAVL